MLGADPALGAPEGEGTLSVLSMATLPQADTAAGEVLATLLRSNPVSSFIAAPQALGGATGQLFLVADLTLGSVPGAEGAAARTMAVGGETMAFDAFATRLSAVVDAFAPERRQIVFVHLADPEGVFPLTVGAFQTALAGAGFGMAVVTVGEAGADCAPAVAPHYAILAGVADRAPFGNGDGMSDAGEVDQWLTRTLARPGQRNPDCAGTYSLIIRTGGDAGQTLAFHSGETLFPEMESQLYLETFEAMFLMQSDDQEKVRTYLAACVYCPNEQPLSENLRSLREREMTQRLEAGIWEDIRTDTRTDRLEIYLANCSLCAFRSEAEALLADLRARADARAAEATAYAAASGARDLSGLRAYAATCVACDARTEAETLIATLEADAAYQAEVATRDLAIAAQDNAALTAWLASCAVCDGRAQAEAALATLIEAEKLVGPCLAAAGLPRQGGPRQLADIALPQAAEVCALALAALPDHAEVNVTLGRIAQAEGRIAEARSAYEAGAATGQPEAYGLGAFLRFAPSGGEAPDFEGAAALARDGTALGDWLSKEILMVLYSRELVSGYGPADALMIARDNAAEGNVAGQFFLGYFLMSGIGTDPDPGSAADWLTRAAGAGYLRAYPFLADLTELGQVIAFSPERAAALYWDALNGGDAIAVARLTDQLGQRNTEVVRIIQQNLRDIGAFNGRADGLPGPGTVNAIRAYADTVTQAG